MRRSSSRDASDRVVLGVARGTLSKAPNDKTKLQEMDVSLHYEEKTTGIERFQEYGFTSVPKAPKDKQKAEVIVVFPDGNRSHGVVVAVDDRRYRPKDLKEGESQLYDDQKQKVHLTREGLDADGGPDKLRQKFTVGDMTITHEKEKTTITLKETTWMLEENKVTTDVNGTKIISTPTKITAYVDAELPVIIKKDKITLGKEDKAKAMITLAGPSLAVFAVLEKD